MFFWLGLSLLSDSSSQDAHFPHCDRNHGYQRHPDLGLRQPRTCVLLCYSVSCQIVWERFPGSRWCRHNPLQHWWPQPLLWIRVSCHGCEQRWPGSSQQHRGHPYKWASTLITTSSCPGTHAELQHHAGPVGASRRAQWPNPGLSGLLQLRSWCPAQRLAEAQHRWQPFHHHLRPGNRYHLQPEGAGLHLSGRWASVWHSTDQNQAGRWEHAHYITAEQCIISSVRLAQIIGEVKVIQIIYCVHVLANAACCCISKLQLEHLRPLKHFFTLIFSSLSQTTFVFHNVLFGKIIFQVSLQFWWLCQFMKHLVIEMHLEKKITPIFTHQAFFLKIRLGYSPKFSFLTCSTQQEMLRFSSIGGAWNISPWTEGARGSALATHSLISSYRISCAAPTSTQSGITVTL